jgi:hypothetical protein
MPSPAFGVLIVYRGALELSGFLCRLIPTRSLVRLRFTGTAVRIIVFTVYGNAVNWPMNEGVNLHVNPNGSGARLYVRVCVPNGPHEYVHSLHALHLPLQSTTH